MADLLPYPLSPSVCQCAAQVVLRESSAGEEIGLQGQLRFLVGFCFVFWLWRLNATNAICYYMIHTVFFITYIVNCSILYFQMFGLDVQFWLRQETGSLAVDSIVAGRVSNFLFVFIPKP